MNTIAIQRIAWKEFRQQRMFFVAMGIVGLLGFFLAMVIPGVSDFGSQFSHRWPAMLIGLFSALYAAGCGATLFATEKEEQTFLNLQILPLTSRQLLTGKLSVAAALCFFICVAAFIVVWLSGSLQADPWLGRNSNSRWIMAWPMTFGLATIEFFAWSMLFSLLLKNPLVAATLGIAAASSTIQTFSLSTYGSEPFVMESYVSAFWPRCILIAMVLAADAWIASRWLNRRLVQETKRRPLFGKRTREQAVATSASVVIAKPSRRRIFGRFFWQALRCSWLLMLVYCLSLTLCLPFGLFAGRIEIAMGILMFVAAVAGVFAFSSDKVSGGVAFLAHHGERPGWYWLANVLLWIGWIVLVNLVVALIVLTVVSVRDAPRFTTHGMYAFYRTNDVNELSLGMGTLFSEILSAVWLTCGMILTFSAGQLCSLLVERRILATMAAIVVCVPVTIWYVLMLASETPLFWSVFPLFITLMAGGCIATRWWIGNRRTFFRIATLLGSILLVWGGLAWLVVQRRSTEIPVVEFDIAEYRRELGEPDVKILEEMQRRFVAAFDGYQVPGYIYGSLSDNYPEILDALQDSNSVPLNERISKSLRDELRMFGPRDLPIELRELAGSSDYKGVELQIELTSRHLEENRQRLSQIADAIQFAVTHMNEIWKMEPSFYRKAIIAGEPALPLHYKVDTWRTVLELDFFDIVRRGDSREAWQRLKTLLLFDSIHRLIYARNDGFAELASFIDIWIEMDGLDRMDVMDALDMSTKGYLRPVSFYRELERSYLANSQAIQNSDWIRGYLEAEGRPQEVLKLQLFEWFPWERDRSMRLLNLWTAWQLVPSGTLEGFHRHYLAATGASFPNFAKWVDNTILPSHRDGRSISELIRQSPRNRNPDHSTDWRYTAIRAEEISEILRLKLAAIAWQLTYGSMPENLQQMEGPEFNLVVPWLPGTDSDGNFSQVPKYELTPKRTGPGDRYIVRANSGSNWTTAVLTMARVPYLVDKPKTQNE